MGWFFGFKLHLVVNEQGETVAFRLTLGNVDDRQPLRDLAPKLFGKVFGDKGYLSQALSELLRAQRIQLVTSLRSNMKPRLMALEDKLMLKKRAMIESINNILKNVMQIDHTRHRSVNGFFVNLIAGLIAYCYHPNKPAIQLETLKPATYIAG